MKKRTNILWIFWLTATLGSGTLLADEKVDEALKSRDMNTIMNLLTVTEKAAANNSRSAETATNLDEADLKSLRERLAAELQVAREEAKRSGLNTVSATDPAPATKTFASSTSEKPTADRPAPSKPAEKDATRSRGIFNRLFSTKSASEPEAKDDTPIQVAQLTPSGATKPVPSPATRPAPAPLIKNANNSANANALNALTAPPPVRQNQPALRDIRQGLAPQGNNVRQNRDALDELIKQSRKDIVNMAMNQASGNDTEPTADADPDAWKEAGPNAWKYNGEWHDGTMHGQGRMTFADGWEYVGMWERGVMHGQGTIVYPDGTKYEGQWRYGKMEGYGTLTYPDGWKFIGMWKAGKIHGSGTLVNPGR